jgi:isopentenyl-diphosphate delta-isomerase
VLTDSEQSADLVILLDESGQPIGSAPRLEVHTEQTPLHLAFSCYLFDERGRLLLTRRALAKRAWPGVWTNSFCGHPRPGEDPSSTVHRYAAHELGVEIAELTCVLPSFRYRATDPGGVVENELCPVYTATAVSPLVPNPDEVVEHRWVSLEELRGAIAAAPWLLSPWMLQQFADLESANGWPQKTAELTRR